MRIKIIFSYNGTPFQGLAPQPNGKGIVNHLQKVLKNLGIKEKLTVSGRTDKGVHALSQVAHTDINNIWENRLDTLQYELNRKLDYILIKSITIAKENFHARFDAKKRVYRYIISTKELDPFSKDFVLHIPKEHINEKLIKESICLFEGEHNFDFFKKQGSNTKTNTRIIYKAKFYKHKHYYIFSFTANSFLRNQIRLMVSFLLEISKQNLSHQDLKSQLSCEKIYFKKPTPPQGLYFVKVEY